MAKFHQRAIAMESHRPACPFEGVDWEGVEDERIAILVLTQKILMFGMRARARMRASGHGGDTWRRTMRA